jgi:uncharacterized membrane protein
MKMCKKGTSWLLLIFLGLFIVPISINAQTKGQDLLSGISYDHPQKFVIGGIDVSGINYLDKSVVIIYQTWKREKRSKFRAMILPLPSIIFGTRDCLMMSVFWRPK